MCTIFVAADGQVTLVGNNEDFVDPFTRVWYVPREGAELEGQPFYGGKYGRVYFGYRDLFPQGGMNEMGLFFDYTAQPPLPVTRSLHKPFFAEPWRLPDHLWSSCATVREALAELDHYNLSMLERACLHMADAGGEAVLFEGDEVLWKQGRFQAGTNFYQSQWDPETPPPCDRYRIAVKMLEEAPEITLDLVRRVLAATHQEGAVNTVYSNIYDLQRKRVYLYYFHNFENAVVIDLEEELKHGARVLDIAELFPESFAVRSHVRRLEYDQAREGQAAQRYAAGTYLRLPESALARLAGVYRGEWLGDMECQVIAAREALYARLLHRGVESVPLVQVHPVGEYECVQPGLRGESRLIFLRDEGGKVNGLEVQQPGGWGYSLQKTA